MVRDYFCLFFLASDIGVLVARLVLVVESSFSFAKEVLGVFSVVAKGFWFAREVLGQFSAFENGFWLTKEVSGVVDWLKWTLKVIFGFQLLLHPFKRTKAGSHIAVCFN